MTKLSRWFVRVLAQMSKQCSWRLSINIKNCKRNYARPFYRTPLKWLHINLVILSLRFFANSCSTNSASPPHLSVAIAGAESYISEVLQAYVEHFSSKPSDWQTFLRILLIPLGKLQNRLPSSTLIATFRLEYEDDYKYEFQVLSRRTSKIFALLT